MGIEDDDVVRVRETSDIVAVIAQYTQLRRVGTRFVGLCPFHNEKSGSFSVNANENLYYCFGCQASGDVITFVREKEHLDFVGAVEHLAVKAGITLRYTDKNEGESRQKKARVVEAVEAAVDWYHQRLLTSPDAGVARGYLRDRGYTGDDVRQFKMGWSPQSWDSLVSSLDVPKPLLIEAGLARRSSNNRIYDFFRGRILFPIFDQQGDAVSFGGRVLPGGEGGKYMNLTQTPVYDKSRVLYGLNWAKTDIVASDEVIVCEGYTDVIGFSKAELPRAVATCGTALTEDHVRLLRRFARRIVLAFDADSAGQAAAERVYEWEKRHDLDVHVVDLPDGQDPGDLSRSDPEALRAAVRDAKSFLGFRVARTLGAADLASNEGRARAADAALDVVREHPQPLLRDQYVMEIAGHCRMDPDMLRRQLTNPNQARRAVTSQTAPAVRADHLPPHYAATETNAELAALWLAVNDRAAATDYLDEVLFGNDVYAQAFRVVVDKGLAAAVSELDPGTSQLLHQLDGTTAQITPSSAFIGLCRTTCDRILAELESRRRSGEDLAMIAPEVTKAKQIDVALKDLNRVDEDKLEVGAELLDWVFSRAENRDDAGQGGQRGDGDS